jgi:hypothetical protein
LLPYEAFYYLSSKLRSNADVVFHSIERKQRFVLYYDDLSMKNDVRVNNIHVIRVLTHNALKALRSILGVGVGIALAKPHPTKCNPIAYCSLGDIITSVEAPPEIPREALSKPLIRSPANAVDFFYTYQSQSLQCNVRFSKLVVATESVAITRIPTAAIHGHQVVAYSGAMFFYGEDNNLLTVGEIENAMATCSYSETDKQHLPPIALPLTVVNPLVERFGRRRQRRTN